jgi:hypothetical protein
MPKSDPHFSHLSQDAREEVFEHLDKAMTELATYIPSARQNPYWKARVVNGVWRKWERWAFMNGWSDDYYFPEIEKCFDSVVEELGILAQVALLDPRLQMEVVTVEGDGYPTWAFPVHRHKWIAKFIEVRPATTVLLLLFQPEFVHQPEEKLMEDLRHELGHAFLYLRDLEVKDDCAAADEEWKRCTQLNDLIVAGNTDDLFERQ